jgi:hypothetical protein
MIAQIKQQRIILLLVASLFVFHIFSKDITNPYERPIAGDAQAYYAYLPALFIYQDLDYKFIQSDAAQYYPNGEIKDFVKEVEGADGNTEMVNKTFPGVAVLYTPFFLIAHGCAYLFGFPADGFSSIYQLWFDIGLWFYFLLGLIFLRKVLLKFDFSDRIATISTVAIALATNIFFYTVYDQSVTHVYNFCMINILIWCLLKFKENQNAKWIILSVGLLALIGITRPTNILVLGLVFFFFPSLDFYKTIFRTIFAKQNVIKVLFMGVLIVSIPLALWKAQTGNWIVYSYGEEGFDFSSPHFGEFIFSYMKGWMTYTPFVIPVLLFGLLLLFKTDKKRALVALSFYIISVYIFSSWWCWYYGAGMSQRVMIDHYILLAFLLATVLKFVWDKNSLRIAFLTLSFLLAGLNIVQAYQIKSGIISFGSSTSEQYWDNFLSFQKKAIIYPAEHWELKEDLELGVYGFATQVNETQEYSASFESEIKQIDLGSKVIISFEAFATTDIIETRMVLVLQDENEMEVPGFPYFLKEYVVQDEWIKMEFMFEPLQAYRGQAKVFFWNAASKEKVQFKNVRYQHYFSEEYY